MMNGIIIDDEARAQRLLKSMINEYCPNVEIIGMASDAFEGKSLIEKTKPDLVFLDVEMPIKSGIQLLEEINDLDINIILTTAYENYAEDGFKHSVLGYLLKPIAIDELQNLVQLAEQHLEFRMADDQKLGLLPFVNGAKNIFRVALPIQYGMTYFSIDELNYIEAEGRYCQVHATSKEQTLINIGIQRCEDVLKNTWFTRVHRSYIVNLRLVKKIVKITDAHLIMENGSRIDIGKSYKESLLEALDFFTT